MSKCNSQKRQSNLTASFDWYLWYSGLTQGLTLLNRGFNVAHFITTLSFARARSRSIKHERVQALFSLYHDLVAVDDVEALLLD